MLKKKKQKQNRKINKKETRLENQEIILKADSLIEKDKNSKNLEYVEEDEYIQAGKYYEEFKKVFQFFKRKQMEEKKEEEEEEEKVVEAEETNIIETECSSNKEETVMGKKKRKLMGRMPVAQLKALSKRPDLVEAWDVTATDPLLLSFLKGYRNTVMVPKHWS